MATEKQDVTFGEWKRTLDALVYGRVGLNLADLADLDYRAAYENGLLPEEFFDETVRDELADLGFAVELIDLLEDEGIEVREFDGDELLIRNFLEGRAGEPVV